jgi:outer membrane lipoprotein-sorting protein
MMPSLYRSWIPFALAARALFALEPKEIMEKVKWQNAAVDDQVKIEMKLIDAAGDVKTRTASSNSKRKAKDKPDLMKLIRFHTPPEMAKAGVLTLENEKGDADQWIYIPAVFTSRRIPSSNRGDRYMGTDFSYEDVVAIKVDQYAFKSLGEETVDGIPCVRIEQVPADAKLKKESGYSKTVNWVDPARFFVLKTEYYDKSGALWKRYTASDVKKYGDYYRAGHAEMEDLKSRHKTVMDYKDRRIGAGLPDKVFTMRSLERGE